MLLCVFSADCCVDVVVSFVSFVIIFATGVVPVVALDGGVASTSTICRPNVRDGGASLTEIYFKDAYAFPGI